MDYTLDDAGLPFFSEKKTVDKAEFFEVLKKVSTTEQPPLEVSAFQDGTESIPCQKAIEVILDACPNARQGQVFQVDSDEKMTRIELAQILYQLLS